jgi:hypothetical protein
MEPNEPLIEKNKYADKVPAAYANCIVLLAFCFSVHICACGVIWHWWGIDWYRSWSGAFMYSSGIFFLIGLWSVLDPAMREQPKARNLPNMVVASFIVLWITWMATHIYPQIF